MRRTGRFRPAVVLALLGVVATLGFAAAPALLRRTDAPAPTTARAHDVLASLPLAFEPLAGGFVSRGPGYQLSLTSTGATIGLPAGTFRLRPAGTGVNPSPNLTGGDQLPGTVNHLQGDDASAWTVGAPTFGGVTAESVWPGVDMVWHGNARRLEHDLVVAPGADPAALALDVEGARSVRLDRRSGDLILDLAAGSARLARPVVYQDVAGTRRTVAGAFTLLGSNRIGFDVGAYDHTAPLVVDPTLVTSTTFGGGGSDIGYSIALDGAGNSYVTGSTESPDFPTVGPVQAGLSAAASGPSTDVFVSKLSPDGSTVLWSTYLGGKGRDTGYSIATGPNGSVYVGGVTESPDFPRVKAAQDAYGGGPSDGFVARLAATGSALDWSTFVGGAQTDRVRGLAVDVAGNAYVTGSTSSVDFPTVNAEQTGAARADDVDAFVTKIPASGGPLTYSTRLGGSNDDHGLAIAVDGTGAAYVTGDTLSPGFPTVRPLQAASGGSASGVAGSFPDAFVAKFAPAGTGLIYSTFLGGSDYDQGTAIAVDGTGAVYLTGSTASPNFPTVNPLQARKDNDADAFAAKIDPTGAALVYSTYLGGGGADGGNGIAVDAAGDAFLTGTTGSTNWPTAKPTQPAKNGGDDAFVVKLNSSGSALLFSSYLGGKDSDSGLSVAVDGQGAVHVVGLTGSTDFPQIKPIQGAGARPPAGGDAFVASISLSDVTGAAPSATAVAGVTDNTHSRRVRALETLTLGLLLMAGLQTVYLRRREAKAPTPQPAGRAPGKAGAGLRVLDDAGIGAGPLKGARAGAAKTAGTGAATATKPGAGSKSTRTPKTRGGPKSGSGPAKTGSKAGGGSPRPQARPTKQPTGARAADPAKAPAGAAGAVGAADEPTMATPAVAPAKPRPQAPAIAQLLEEDMWEPDFRPAPAAPAETPPADAAPPSPAHPDAEASPAPAMAAPPPPAIPPVPAAELSFWDLFPEDLPPARPVVFPADDLLALPDGPDSVAGRLATDPGATPVPPPVAPGPPPPPAGPPPPPAEAEFVIAELLDGPAPTSPGPAPSPWAATPVEDDFLISDLLARPTGPDEGPAAPPPAAPAARADQSPPASRPSAEEQARIAADQARRRRARRGGGGRRNRPGGG